VPEPLIRQVTRNFTTSITLHSLPGSPGRVATMVLKLCARQSGIVVTEHNP
jgi:hypothetical protein